MNDGQRLDVGVTHQVHPALRLEVAFTLPCACGVLFGASGTGKTTLLRLIAGLTTPGSGRISLGPHVLFDSAAAINRPLRLRQVGMIFQDDLLFPHLDVAANIRFGLKGQSRSDVAARLAEVAALCGVEHLLARRPATLSGGERQRVGLARALAPRPSLLLCDEPVSALDLENRYALIDRLRTVQQSEAIPLLCVTHNPAEAIALGTHLFLLASGTIADQGPPLEVLARQAVRSGVSAALAGVRNVFPATVEGSIDEGSSTVLQLRDGPRLIVPYHHAPPGTMVTVTILAEEILLAAQSVEGLSARNSIAGTIEQVITHGGEAEVLVRTGAVVWIASVVARAVAALRLAAGVDVQLVIKARSCHVRPAVQ